MSAYLRRFLTGCSVAVMLAGVAILVSRAGDCHPATCHTYEPWSFWWLYFECWTAHCEACGWGPSEGFAILGALIAWAV